MKDLKSKTVEEAFEEWEGTEETYRWNMVRAAACHGTPDDSYPFSSGWKAAEKEFASRLEEAQQRNEAKDAEVAAKVLEKFAYGWGKDDDMWTATDIRELTMKEAAEYRAKAGRKE